MFGWLKFSRGDSAPDNRTFDSHAPDDSRIYAIGDIHGQSEKLRRIHEAIAADAAEAPETRKTIVYVGDYVDRGPDPAGVLDMLIAPPDDGFERVFVKGNHEDFMLRYLDGDIAAGADWIANGGAATLTSYGVGNGSSHPNFSDLAEWRGDLVAAVPAAHRRFLDNLALYHVAGDYAFVHAGVRPGRALAAQDPQDLMWIRGPFLNSKAEHGHVIVHGHTVTRRVENLPNRIGIDTGAGYGKALTAVILYGTTRAFLSA